jgi:hypothetical protein
MGRIETLDPPRSLANFETLYFAPNWLTRVVSRDL